MNLEMEISSSDLISFLSRNNLLYGILKNGGVVYESGTSRRNYKIGGDG